MKKMSISISPHAVADSDFNQQVFFVNVLNGKYGDKYEKTSYEERLKDNIGCCLLNYEDYLDDSLDVEYFQGYCPITNSETDTASIFKQEIAVGDSGSTVELTSLKPVNINTGNFSFRDFNISNNRRYRYVLYPFDPKYGEDLEKSTVDVGKIRWSAWSITELHPTDSTMKYFTANQNDVWLFNLNVSTGAQTQNISRTAQQTLGRFNQFGQGALNYVSGSVSCLLGSQVVPAWYAQKKTTNNNERGYQERRIFEISSTSNERADMLMAWRKLIFSSNPKLLKDRFGQSFIVVLSDSTNQPMDNVGIQPNTINFNWTQIATTEDVQILDEDL